MEWHNTPSWPSSYLTLTRELVMVQNHVAKSHCSKVLRQNTEEAVPLLRASQPSRFGSVGYSSLGSARRSLSYAAAENYYNCTSSSSAPHQYPLADYEDLAD